MKKFLDFTSEDSGSTCVGWEPRIWISNRFPGDADAKGAGAILRITLVYPMTLRGRWCYLQYTSGRKMLKEAQLTNQ